MSSNILILFLRPIKLYTSIYYRHVWFGNLHCLSMNRSVVYFLLFMGNQFSWILVMQPIHKFMKPTKYMFHSDYTKSTKNGIISSYLDIVILLEISYPTNIRTHDYVLKNLLVWTKFYWSWVRGVVVITGTEK
jgi:hypothetical protein